MKAWQTFANDYGLNAEEVAHASHGRRLYDTLKEYCHIDDENTLQVCQLLATLHYDFDTDPTICCAGGNYQV
jgi:hypothetical protein